MQKRDGGRKIRGDLLADHELRGRVADGADNLLGGVAVEGEVLTVTTDKFAIPLDALFCCLSIGTFMLH